MIRRLSRYALSLLAAAAVLSGSKPPAEKAEETKLEIKEPQGNLFLEYYYQLQISDGRYTPLQAFRRAGNIWNKTQRYKRPPYALYKLFNTCTQPDLRDWKVPADARFIWRAWQDFQKTEAPLARGLADFAIGANIFFCPAQDPNTGGLWSEEPGVADVDNREKRQQHAGETSAHESIHALQGQNGILTNHDLQWTLAERQALNLGYEAAAASGGVLTVFDLHLHGIEKHWRAAQHYHPTVAQAINEAHAQALKKGATPEQALTQAGEAGFFAALDTRAWLDFYNDRLLNLYLTNILSGKMPLPAGNLKFDRDMIRRAGIITPDINITAKIVDMPAYKDRFKNSLMRQAFDWVEYVRYERAFGADHMHVEKMRGSLLADQNPFMDIDPKAALTAADKRSGSMRTLLTLCSMSNKLDMPIRLRIPSKLKITP